MLFLVSNATNAFHCQFFPCVSGDISDIGLDGEPLLHSWESMETIYLTAEEYQDFLQQIRYDEATDTEFDTNGGVSME